LLIGETYLPFDQLANYYGHDLRGAQLPFNFHLMQYAHGTRKRSPQLLKITRLRFACRGLAELGYWESRSTAYCDQDWSRPGAHRSHAAAYSAWDPTMYYGDEIGMKNVVIPASEVQDPAEKNEPGKGMGRDPERTPMQWDSSPQAGFTEGVPWLRLAADHATVNVAVLSGQSESILGLYRKLIDLRRSNAALNTGGVENVASDGNVLRYERFDGEQRFAVLLNLGERKEEVAIAPGEIVCSTHMDRSGEDGWAEYSLRPFEGIVIKVAVRG
jgi:alpha-glucosidase